MSHQVLITFDIDENKVAENAEKEAGRQIAKAVTESVFGTGYSAEKTMKQYVRDQIEEMIKSHKDEIIQKAVETVVENLHRTKAVREKLEEELK